MVTVKKEKITNHNGKEVKEYSGKNVRIPTEIYDSVRDFCYKNGLLVGWYFSNAAAQQLKLDKRKQSTTKK